MRKVFVILNWQGLHFDDMALVSTKSGKARVFASHKKAQEYAETNLNFNWKIVEIEV